MAKKSCQNISCPMKGTSVTTDRNSCMSCGRALSDPIGDLVDSFMGTGFGGTRDKNRMPSEVRLLLVRIDSVLAIIVDGKAPTTKGTLRGLREAIEKNLEEYG